MLRLADAAPGPTTHDSVARVLVDISIAATNQPFYAILQSGAVRCWGRNDHGQLGRGNTANIGDNETVYSAGDLDLGASVIVSG